MAAAPKPPADRPPRRRTRFAAFGLAAGIALALAVVVALTWLSTEHALRTVVAALVERMGERLVVEDVRGSLAGTLHVGRIAWRDDGLEIVAEDVAIAFSPASALRGAVAVAQAHAQRLQVTLPPPDGQPLRLPESIALPIALDVQRLIVDEVAWRRGEASGTLSGLSLAYAGDGDGHRVSGLAVRTHGAALAGDASVGARKPFDMDVRVALDLAAPYPAGRVEATAKGSLDTLALAGTSTLAGVAAEANVRLAPLAAQPIIAGALRARDVDLRALDPGWPLTRLDATIDARPASGGFEGTLRVANAAPGPLDRDRVPLAQVDAAFALRERVLALHDVRARVAGGGSASGAGTIALDGWRNRWQLAIDALDLRAIHAALASTKLAGRVVADVQAGEQRLSGDVAQGDLRVAFDARYDGRTLVAPRVAVSTRGSRLSGNARVTLDGTRPFAVEARAERFDPSRFGALPAGALDGTLRAEGTLAGAPVARADVAIAPTSRLAGLPFAGSVRGRFTRDSAEGLQARLALGATRLEASGAVNRGTQPLDVAIAAGNLAELAPLLPKDAPRLAGALQARARLEPRAGGAAFVVDGRGERLRIGSEWAFATLRVDARGVHAAPLRAPRLAAIADANIAAQATGIVSPQGALDRASATFAGSLAAHTLALAAARERQAIEARASGALADVAASPVWRGRVQSLAIDGAPGFARVALAAPADLELARDRVVLGPARLAGGETLAEVDVFAWRDGRLTTRGRVRGLALAPFARLAGGAARWPTDLVVGGRWDIASSPAWTGVVALQRERGDVYVDEPVEGEGRIALGLETLRVTASIDGARLALNGELRARLAGATLVDATAQAPAGSLHPFDASARLGGTLRAHVPALATLQPWIGTAARVQGQAIAEVNLAGTLGDPSFTGQVVGYGLRIDMPQYGIALADGRLRIVSGADGLRLEEFAFAGGEGRLTASGSIALPRLAGGAGATRIAWRAENFRALNHPDRRLVVDGEGTLARSDGRWRLAGRVAVDEGNVAYRSTADTRLADDIVVVGRERPRRQDAANGAAAPLDLDLAIELGRDLRFAAEGLDTRLAGKLELRSRKGEPIAARGTIRTVRGTYHAFGQKLDIDRGRLVFDGPVANPSLDIVALRRNLAVEAGVEISGTVRAPIVRLTSSPPVPDSEKLSWLLTGGPPGAATQREMIALQAAQAALAGRGGRSMSQRFAQNVGVDDIALVNRGDGKGDDLLAGQVVSVGKRITERLYVAYEQGLEIATNALRIEYVLSRYLTVSAFAGTTSGVELKFRRNWR